MVNLSEGHTNVIVFSCNFVYVCVHVCACVCVVVVAGGGIEIFKNEIGEEKLGVSLGPVWLNG